MELGLAYVVPAAPSMMRKASMMPGLQSLLDLGLLSIHGHIGHFVVTSAHTSPPPGGQKLIELITKRKVIE